MIPLRLVIGIALLAVVLPGAAAAQGGSPGQELQLERREKKAVVQPEPDAARAGADADAAARTIERERLMDDVQRRAGQPAASPQTDETLSGGIQSENLRKVLKP
jgi:hypothetical protein